jgi:hypothetical protein
MMTKAESLIETLRAVNFKSADPVQVRGHISQIRTLIDSDHVDDLAERVQLLRIWYALGQMLVKIEPETDEALADPQAADDVEQVNAAIASRSDIIVEALPDETAEKPVAFEISELNHAQKTPILELAEFDEKVPLPSRMPQDERRRMRLVKEGLLEDQILPVGTIVLVHQTDADHLLQEHIAVELPFSDED